MCGLAYQERWSSWHKLRSMNCNWPAACPASAPKPLSKFSIGRGGSSARQEHHSPGNRRARFRHSGQRDQAAVDALHKGWTHYGPSAGLPELRQTIADYVSRTRGVKVTPEEVVVVPGGKPIIFFTILALIDEGDEVIYPNPGFPIYESMIRYVGGNAVPTLLREERDFSVDVDELASRITDRTKLIILNSPHNPTGGVMQRRDVEQLAKVIGDRNILVLSDEIYSRLLFEGAHFSMMSVPGIRSAPYCWTASRRLMP